MPPTEVITRPGATPIWSRELNGIGVVLPPWAMVVALATVLVPPTFTITTPVRPARAATLARFAVPSAIPPALSDSA